jgi:hypothetical protein
VIYHETLHAYLYATYGAGFLGDAQHEAMATKYLNAIIGAVVEAFPNSSTDISKLAWSGLHKTNGFKWGTLSHIEQGIILHTIEAHRQGNAGSTCQ